MASGPASPSCCVGCVTSLTLSVMLRWGLACSVLVGWKAAAQPAGVAASVAPAEPPTAPAQVVGYGAMPGGIHVPDASTLPAGALQLITLDGYGFRKGALATEHT